MSFLKKNGQRVWVPEVMGRKYVPGYWYTYDEYVPKYVPGSSGGSTPIVTDRDAKFDHGLGGSDHSGLIVDY